MFLCAYLRCPGTESARKLCSKEHVVTGECTYTQVFKAGGSFGAGCSGSQAGQTPEEENN